MAVNYPGSEVLPLGIARGCRIHDPLKQLDSLFVCGSLRKILLALPIDPQPSSLLSRNESVASPERAEGVGAGLNQFRFTALREKLGSRNWQSPP